MGHLISAQLSDAMQQAIGPLEEHVSQGNEHQLLAWLREDVHPIGRMMNAEKLVKRVIGQALSRQPSLDCLEGKLKHLKELNRRA